MTKRWNVVDEPSQTPDLSSTENVFHLLKTRLKAKSSENKQEVIMVPVQAC